MTTKSERESTLKLFIDRDVFERESNDKNWQWDIIINYNNGVRLSARHYQRKVYLTKSYVSLFHHGRFYPILRTRAEETLLPRSAFNDNDAVIKCTNRLCVNINMPVGYGICRLALNKSETDHGISFYLTCEIEYDLNIEYMTMLQVKHFMLDVCLPFIKKYVSADSLQRDKSTMKNMFVTTAPKIQMWSQFNPEETHKWAYKWAYKWNGIKAKMMVKNKDVYIWSDSMPIQTHTFTTTTRDNNDGGKKDLSTIEQINFQVEIMPTSIVIVYTLSVSFYDKVHLIEPYSNIDYLDHLRTVLAPTFINYVSKDNSVVLLHLKLQRFFEPPRHDSFNKKKYDGFILVQRAMFIKWKQPTIDARYLGNSVFEVGDSNGKIVRFTLESRTVRHCVKDNIYELSAKKRVLRLRNDRLFCSTFKEYEMFLNSISSMLVE